MENICPSVSQCPIFNGILKDKVITTKSFKQQYCEAGEGKFKYCKRYLTKQKFGKCPPDLLPNSSMTIEQIGVKYQLD
jgi:hypothetical protein